MKKECKFCNKEFNSIRSKTLFCSVSCKNYYFWNNDEYKNKIKKSHQGKIPWNKGLKLGKSISHSQKIKRMWKEGVYDNRIINHDVETRRLIGTNVI